MAVIISRRSSHCPNFATAPYAALGGSISAAMILVPSFLFTQAGLSRELAALLIAFGLLALWTTIFGLRLNARTSS